MVTSMILNCGNVGLLIHKIPDYATFFVPYEIVLAVFLENYLISTVLGSKKVLGSIKNL